MLLFILCNPKLCDIISRKFRCSTLLSVVMLFDTYDARTLPLAALADDSILDFIREDLLAHFSFPFWLHIMIGQLTGCSKKRAKADWLMTCAKADWLRTNVVTFFLLSDWLVQNLPLF